MTEMERFAALVLSQWHAGGGRDGGPIGIGDLLDSILPYRVARRYLQLDASEDYELLVMRLVSEEGGLVTTSPAEAAEMARATMAESLPDLDVLHLLRSATVTLTEDSLYRLEGVRPLPASPPEPVDNRPDDGAADEGILPMRRGGVRPGADAQERTPPPNIEQVEFVPPGGSCWSCGGELPRSRQASFCVQCGADQRKPQCSNCGVQVERDWRFCPDCGSGL